MKTRNWISALASAAALAEFASAYIYASQMTEAPLKFICAFDTVIKYIVGPIAILFFIMTGARYIEHADDPGERTKSKERLKHIIVGLLIIIVGRAFVSFVPSAFGATIASCP